MLKKCILFIFCQNIVFLDRSVVCDFLFADEIFRKMFVISLGQGQGEEQSRCWRPPLKLDIGCSSRQGLCFDENVWFKIQLAFEGILIFLYILKSHSVAACNLHDCNLLGDYNFILHSCDIESHTRHWYFLVIDIIPQYGDSTKSWSPIWIRHFHLMIPTK